MIRKKIRLLIPFICFGVSLFAQTLTKNYVIFTFEDTYKISQHKKKVYFWIAPEDSITNLNYPLSHLFLNNLSTKDMVDCENELAIDPTVYFKEPNDTFDMTANTNANFIKNLLSNNKKKLMAITKKSVTGQVEKIIIYATPVTGDFCFTAFHIIGQHAYNYKGNVCVPLSKISLNPIFWNSEASKFVIHRDFSQIDFDVIYY